MIFGPQLQPRLVLTFTYRIQKTLFEILALVGTCWNFLRFCSPLALKTRLLFTYNAKKLSQLHQYKKNSNSGLYQMQVGYPFLTKTATSSYKLCANLFIAKSNNNKIDTRLRIDKKLKEIPKNVFRQMAIKICNKKN